MRRPMLRCPRCGKSNERDARFCMGCGDPVDRTCAACDAVLPGEARFCPACGAPVQAAAVLEMIKPVTVMFADVVGSTAQAEQMTPEDTRALMAEFFEAMMTEIEDEGGTVERLIGDAIMADFGVPVAHEDDPLRAVRAARRMFDRLEKFNTAKPASARIQMRIGINTGEVSTGGSFGERLMVMGDAVNVAARLEQTATPGSIVIGERTARSVRSAFELKSFPPLEVKGRNEPVRAFLVGAEKTTRLTQDFLAPLFGRDAELEALRVLLARVQREDKPLVVTVVGDPGIGKSRLVSEFVTRLPSQTKVLWGRCLPYGQGMTLSPFREILLGEIGIFGNDDPDAAAAKIRSFVGTLPLDPTTNPERVVGALAATIGLPGGLASLGRLDPREIYREILNAWQALLTNLATERPTIVILDDLYWADDSTLDLLQRLSKLRLGPVMFIGLVRPEFSVGNAGWIAGLKNYAALTLDALSTEASTQLVAALLSGQDAAGNVTSAVLTKAEGNPFYLEEIIQRLIDDGSLVRENGAWTLGRELNEREVPETVQAVVLSRIDLLTPAQKRALQVAAVVGRHFWLGAVRRITDLEDAAEILDVLKRRNLVEEQLDSAVPGEKEYSFRHLLIRNVAYDTLPRGARGRAHVAVAHWVEEVRGERAGEVAELLAHHYAEAFRWLGEDDLRQRARDRYLEATEAAVRRFAIRQAESLAERALELSEPGAERVMAFETLGDVFLLTFKSDRAWTSYRAALQELETSGVLDGGATARLAAKASIVPTRWRGTMQTLVPTDDIEALINRGLEVAPVAGRDRVLLTASRASLFALLREQGALEDAAEGEVAARHAITVAEDLGDAELLSVAMDVASMWLMNEGRYGELSELDQRRLELAPQLVDVREASDAYAMVAASSYSIGRYPEAFDFATRCIERSRGLDAGSYLHGLVWMVCAGFMTGRWDDARSAYGEIVRLQSEEASDLPTNLTMWAHGVALLGAELRGDEAEAERCLSLIERFNERRADEGRDFHSYLGAPARALARRGGWVKAREWLRTERSFYSGSHLEALCDVVGEQGDWGAAPDVIAAARAEVDACGLIALGCFADRLGSRAAGAGGALDDAVRLAQRSAEGFAGLGAPWEAAYSRLLEGESRLAAGDRDAAGRCAQEARPALERLASIRELQRLEKLLAELG